jgi:hypothetical protein
MFYIRCYTQFYFLEYSVSKSTSSKFVWSMENPNISLFELKLKVKIHQNSNVIPVYFKRIKMPMF